MSMAGWLVLVGFLAVLCAVWIAFTASRLDGLHARLDAAQAALDAQLVRRVAALRHVSDAPVADPPAGSQRLSDRDRSRIESIAQVALTAAGADRQAAENEVGRAVADIAGRGVPLSSAQRD